MRLKYFITIDFNQLSSLVSEGQLDIKILFSVGKDDEGNELRAFIKADTNSMPKSMLLTNKYNNLRI